MSQLQKELESYLVSKEYDLSPKKIDECVEFVICSMNEYPKYDGNVSPEDYDIDRNTDFTGDMTEFFGNIYNNPYDGSIQTLIDEMYRAMFYSEFNRQEDEVMEQTKRVEKEFFDLANREDYAHLMDKALTKITLGYINSFFTDEELMKIAEMKGRDSIKDLFYGIRCNIDGECANDVINALLEQYPDVLEI